MENLILKQQRENVVYTLNELYNDGKIYIMDNHLAASWCWSQKIDFESTYNLFHIDRHYDLLNNAVNYWVKQLQDQNFDFKNVTIEDYTEACYESSFEPYTTKIFRYDNYLTIFNRFFPRLLQEKYFVTHRDGTVPEEWHLTMHEPPFYDLDTNLEYWINDADKKWILNIDIDYFFSDNSDGVRYQIFTDEYITNIGLEISKCIDNIEVLTIALSPSFCNGIMNSKRVAKLLLKAITNRDYDF
jgi:hypothetical protein